jgi:hypothetical protein
MQSVYAAGAPQVARGSETIPGASSGSPGRWRDMPWPLRRELLAAAADVVRTCPAGLPGRVAESRLLAAGLPACQVTPFKLRQFAKASGILAKSDRLDARVIASFIAIMPTRRAQRHSLATERLTEILTVRRQLSDEKIAAQNASAMLEDAMQLRLSRRRIGRLAADMDIAGHKPDQDRANRCRARTPIRTPYFHAGGRTGTGLHPDRALARVRQHEP